MKKTLASASDHTEIVERIAALTPASQRLWGSMSVGGMVCHLCDAYRVPLGEVAWKPVELPLPRSVMKAFALHSPTPWPKNIQTTEEVRQGGGGTLPGDFAADKARLLDTLERFCACPGLARIEHAFFGPMSHADWMRWGYLHADHHLRQFSA
jgi:hypothetical protein